MTSAADGTRTRTLLRARRAAPPPAALVNALLAAALLAVVVTQHTRDLGDRSHGRTQALDAVEQACSRRRCYGCAVFPADVCSGMASFAWLAAGVLGLALTIDIAFRGWP